MIEMIETDIENAVAFRISGKITRSDMERVLADAREKIGRYGNIVILEQIDSWKGVEIAALVEEFKYLYEVGFSNVSKAAVVTDKTWIDRIVSIEDKIFRSIEMKCFPLADYDLAIEFLQDP